MRVVFGGFNDEISANVFRKLNVIFYDFAYEKDDFFQYMEMFDSIYRK